MYIRVERHYHVIAAEGSVSTPRPSRQQLSTCVYYNPHKFSVIFKAHTPYLESDNK